ncbi:MAG: thiamine-monophosphate kinase [Planctomycetota bacterium]|nr:MAG: thiamine-monophosphate kinase [Planctomycetota bacterium]
MEREFLRRLRKRIGPAPQLRVPIGDDAAVFEWPSNKLPVLAVDVIADGVDFLLDQCDPRLVGRKALAVNLSDLAAMGALPTACVIGLSVPKSGIGDKLDAIYDGLFALAEEFDTAVAGGDLGTHDGPLSLAVTVLGEVEPDRILRRNGARPGDKLLVTGSLGGSILGRHFTFRPRIREARQLTERFRVTAAIDLSDGLAVDAAHLAEESGCGLVISNDRIPVSADAERLARQDGRSAVEHALGDGEDFELLFTMPPAEADRLIAEPPFDVPVTVIGECVPEQGVWLAYEDRRVPMPDHLGYEHHFD